MSYISNVLSGFYSLLSGMRVTLKYMLRRPVTEVYPKKKKEMFPRFKGPTSFVVDEKTKDHRCIACDLCAKICPSLCIQIDKERGDDKKFHLVNYKVDYTLCSLCSLCIEVCPTDALTHAKDYELPAFSQSELIMDFLKPFREKQKANEAPKQNL
ncbi:MAG: NADH-quinone oxidoreductase subunit I [Chlamydiae bacterium]|nr:NADH-quinone oxidoreductase subunit I [Chlamydiota bacterium]MBI3277822.1 NADH-quinone oxidoreductase subunit I [Chlamydiota bacterium]